MKLTRREMEVWRLVSQGVNIKGITKVLNIGETTARTYLAHIYDELNLTNSSPYRHLYTTAALMYLNRFNNDDNLR